MRVQRYSTDMLLEKFEYGYTWTILLFVCTVCFLPGAAADTPMHPFPVHALYASGTIIPDHLSRAQLDADVANFYDQWKSDYLVNMGGVPARYRVSFGSSNPGRTVSEGQGFGMIITALMAGYDSEAQEIFDGLYYFAVDHPSNIDSRLMAWEFPEDPGGEDSAFDGDADIAYGLILAHAQWGSTGAVDYHTAALTRIAAILDSCIGPQSHLPTLGDWVDYNGATYNQYTPRTSDFMPSHFRTFQAFTGSSAWADVVAAVQSAVTHMQDTYSPATGLLPDFCEPVSTSDHTLRPADPGFLEGSHDGDYYYNAGRDPWRIGMDALVHGDTVSMNQTQNIADWIAQSTGENPYQIKAGYTLDGTPVSGGNYFTTFFAAPFGVAMMTRPAKQQFLNDIYDSICATHENYYEDSVNLLCLIVITGNYWNPEEPEPALPSLDTFAVIALVLLFSALLGLRR